MKSISIDSFQQLTGLTDTVMLTLIKAQALPLTIDKSGEPLVAIQDLELLSVIDALNSVHETTHANQEALLVAECSRILTEKFDELLKEVI